jgi:hypothetical protein
MSKKSKYLLLFIGLMFLMNSIFGQTNPKQKIFHCDDSLLNRVYHLYRLQVLEKCKRVTGVVAAAKFEPDGDAHLSIKLDSGQENLLYPMNFEKQHGYLIVEPVCATLIDGKDAEQECQGYVNKVYLPQIGDHVEIIGTYVLDTKHSWAEIHPVTSITPLIN